MLVRVGKNLGISFLVECLNVEFELNGLVLVLAFENVFI